MRLSSQQSCAPRPALEQVSRRSRPQEWDTNQMQLTDGGGSDYHAIYPALRRRVANIIVLSASK